MLHYTATCIGHFTTRMSKDGLICYVLFFLLVIKFYQLNYNVDLCKKTNTRTYKIYDL